MKPDGILFEHGVLNANEVMIDYLDDNQRRLKRAMAEIGDTCLHWTPDPGANSIAVTVEFVNLRGVGRPDRDDTEAEIS